MENEQVVTEPVVNASQDEDFELDSKGNFIQKKQPKSNLVDSAKVPGSDLKSNLKSEFESARADVLNPVKEQVEPTPKKMHTEDNGQEKETVPEKKKYKIKYDGREEEVEAGDQEIIEALQKSRDYTKKTQEVATARREAETVFKLVDNMKNNPDNYFDFATQHLGFDPIKIAEQRLLEKYKYELMPPNEQQQYDLTKENSQLKMELEKHTQDKAQSEEQAKAQAEALQQEANDEKALQDIGEFFDSRGIEPDNDMLIDVINMMLRYVESPNPLTVAQAWEKVNGREQSKKQKLLKTLKPEDLDEELKKSLRQADVDRIKTNKPWQNSPKKEPSKPKVEGNKSVSSEDYFKEIGKMFK